MNKDVKPPLDGAFRGAFDNLVNFLGSVFSNSAFCSRFAGDRNKTLVEYFSELISYEIFLEKKNKIKNPLGVHFHQILKNITHDATKLTIIENVTVDDISIQINLIKTYLLNIYKLNFKRPLLVFDHTKINDLVRKTKLVGEESTTNNTFEAKTQTSETNPKTINNFNDTLTALLRNFSKKNGSSPKTIVTQAKQQANVVNNAFYPFDSKPRIIVYLKWILVIFCSCLTVLSFLLAGNAILANDYFGCIIYIIALLPLSRLVKVFFDDISLEKVPRRRYTFHFLMLANVSFVMILLTIISWENFHFQFSSLSGSTGNVGSYHWFSCLFGTITLFTWFVAVITYIFNPKINKEKLKKFQDDFLQSMTSDFDKKN